MTSPRRSKKSDTQCALQNSLDWDSPSTDTGTVKRRRSSDPEASLLHPFETQEAILEVQTPSDSGSGTSRSIDGSDRTDSNSLVEVEQRISCIINENRSSQSNSECSEADFIIDSILANPDDEALFRPPQDEAFVHTRGKTFIKTTHRHEVDSICATNTAEAIRNKGKERKVKPPLPIPKLNRTLDLKKTSSKVPKELPKPHEKISVLPIYRSTFQGPEQDLSAKKKVGSKLRLPFSPVRTMDKPKMNFFQSKAVSPDSKHSPLLSSPVRRTISNEYVRLKFTNDTLMRRTIDGKSVQKIMPKIQSIIPESPVDSEDPFLNLSPNKKYTVTVNNKVRCDKDNYVIFDPATGFKPDEVSRQSRIPLKSPSGSDKSKIPMKSPVVERPQVRHSVNVSDTDSGILSPNSPVETSADEASAYANAASFSSTAKKCAGVYDIKILDPGLAKKAAEQLKVSRYLPLFYNIK